MIATNMFNYYTAILYYYYTGIRWSFNDEFVTSFVHRLQDLIHAPSPVQHATVTMCDIRPSPVQDSTVARPRFDRHRCKI